MANFSVALLVCSLMKTTRQQEKGLPSGEGRNRTVHRWPGRWPSVALGHPIPIGVSPSQSPPRHPTAGLGAGDAAGCRGAPRHCSPTGWGLALASQMPWRGFPDSPPLNVCAKSLK